MGSIYRVTVTREARGDDGDIFAEETLFELAVANPGMLARIAPSAIAEALDETGPVTSLPSAPVNAADVTPPRRARRTKAQLAEDARLAAAGSGQTPLPEPTPAPAAVDSAPYNPFGVS